MKSQVDVSVTVHAKTTHRTNENAAHVNWRLAFYDLCAHMDVPTELEMKLIEAHTRKEDAEKASPTTI